jgi:hypothetical protein
MFFEGAFHEVGVERVGADNGTGLVLQNQVTQFVFRFAHQRQTLFGKIMPFGGEVDSAPKPGGMGGHLAIEALQASVEKRGSKGTRVSTECGGVHAQGASQVERSAVVPFTKTSGEYQDVGFFTHGEIAHGPTIDMLGGCVNKAIGLFALSRNEQR